MVTFAQLGRYGRLGNQMFQVASTIGIAKANGYDYVFPEWVNHDAVERFGSKEDVNSFTIDNQAQARLRFGDWQHTVLLGLDHQRTQFDAVVHYGGSAPPIDVYAPVYGSTITLNAAPFIDSK